MKQKLCIDSKSLGMLFVNVRIIDPTRVMIEGDRDSLLYLSNAIRSHALGEESCGVDVPTAVNLLPTPLDENEFNLYLHRLPCTEFMDTDS